MNDLLKYINKEEINEAMVQIAGSKKPSGAKVLAKITVEMLVDKGYFTKLPKDFIPYAKEDIEEVIINSTF